MKALNNKKVLVIIIHIAIWSCFFVLPYFFRPQGINLPKSFSSHFIKAYTINGIFLVLFYYLNTLLLIPKLLFKKKWILYILSVLSCYIFYVFVPKELINLASPMSDITIDMHSFKGNKDNFGGKKIMDSLLKFKEIKIVTNRKRPPNFFIFSNGSYLLFFLIFTIGTCIAVIQQWLKAEATNKAVQTEKLNTELSFLKSQINPHFFFNTLNNIYSLAIVNSVQTAPSILRLSAIMRYILSDAQNEKVPLESEVAFVQNFIDLQLVRLTDKVNVVFNATGAIENKTIAPLLFIPFVENAFKYGVSTKENATISINVLATEKIITISVQNTIIKTENTLQETTGIGLNNVKRRLALLYPDLHKLEIVQQEHLFFVQLDIFLV